MSLGFGQKGYRQSQQNQPVFQGEIDSTSSPNTHILLPSGIIVFGVENWVTKLANVA